MDLTAPARAKSASADIARKSASEALFSCESIYLDLGGREILRDISLSVSAGEVLGIIGPNGAGKTSLFEVLSGRIPAKSGQVWFRGAEITELPLHDRARRGIGRTYQTPVVPDELTVGQSLKAARQAFRPYLTRHHAEWGTELVGLDVDYDLPTSQLDTLDRRKLLLACLLMRRPSVLLLDEPAAGLINSEVDELDDLIRVLSKEMNFAVIIVEHRIELLETIADRVMVMDAGETISHGSLADVLLDPKVHAAYFENVEEDAPVEIERPRAGDGALADTAASPDLVARDADEREVLRISGLSAGYGPMRVIHDLDLVVKAGECIGLVGLNGHGKSTLFLAIAGLTGWQRGSIQLNGMEVGRTRSQGPGRYTHQIVSRGLALMPQGDEIFHGLSVEEHLDLGAFTPDAWNDRGRRKAEILTIFPPLKDLLHTPVGRLSGGERRMVAIGRGLMAEASLYLIDEPSLGLAPKIGKGVLDALASLELGDASMIIAEQNVAVLEGRVDRVLGMHVGKLKGEASASLSDQVKREF